MELVRGAFTDTNLGTLAGICCNLAQYIHLEALNSSRLWAWPEKSLFDVNACSCLRTQKTAEEIH